MAGADRTETELGRGRATTKLHPFIPKLTELSARLSDLPPLGDLVFRRWAIVEKSQDDRPIALTFAGNIPLERFNQPGRGDPPVVALIAI